VPFFHLSAKMLKRPVLKALNLKGALYPGRRRAEYFGPSNI
jgi:hypothetical protein